MPFDPIVWSEQEVITSSKLNKMVANDTFLRNRKVAGVIRNVDSAGNEDNNLRYIKENLVLISGYKEFRPGTNFPDTQAEGVDDITPVFEKQFKFPKNTFDPQFKPVVVATIGTKRGIRKIGYTLKEITTSGFTISIREFSKNLNLTSDMEYFICWIAMGVTIPK